jgi:hypothetical protein
MGLKKKKKKPKTIDIDKKNKTIPQGGSLI